MDACKHTHGGTDNSVSCSVCLQSASCAADAAGNHRGEHQPLSGQPYRTLQVRPEHKVFTPRANPPIASTQKLSGLFSTSDQVSDDAHRSAVPDVGRAADEPKLPVPAHLPHHRLPHHRARHPPQHHGEFTLVAQTRLILRTSRGGDLPSPPPQVLVVKARCIYRRIVTSNGYLGSEQRASFSVMDRRMVLYPLVFVFCWGPGLFGADSDWSLLATDAVSEVSACLCLSCCFLSGDPGVSASGGSRGVPGQSRGGAVHPAGESVPEKHDGVYALSSFSLFLVACRLFLLNSLFDLDLLTAVEHFVVEFVCRAHFVVFECSLCVTMSH